MERWIEGQRTRMAMFSREKNYMLYVQKARCCCMLIDVNYVLSELKTNLQIVLGKNLLLKKMNNFLRMKSWKIWQKYIWCVLIEVSDQKQNLVLGRYIISIAYYYRASFQWQKTVKYTIWMEEPLHKVCWWKEKVERSVALKTHL